MKIVHICLACFFPDGYSYQENLLPKYHKKLGYDVEVIASLVTFDENGKPALYPKAKKYVNENDILVTRLDYRRPLFLYKKIRKYKGFKQALELAKPDIIFIHGCQFMDIKQIIRYAKKNDVKIYVDNHADFSNSAIGWVRKNILHKILWRYCAKSVEPYTKKFYGVLPARVDFLCDLYGLPSEKCELLVMGADDELVVEADDNAKKIELREKYGINPDDFLIMTGGKIDQWKTQTLLLMEAVREIKNEKVKLIVFGSVTPELLEKVHSLCYEQKVQYVGWIESNKSYDLFAIADLVVFPGRHSVFWEQVVGQGIPMIVKDWPGTHHVDLGGNVCFLAEDSKESIREEIEKLINNENQYLNMKKIAQENGMKTFSYLDIAKRSISD